MSIIYSKYYAPLLPKAIKCLYDVSCFSYLVVALALWYYGTYGILSGRLLLGILPLQSIISYKADVVEFFSNENIFRWQIIDRFLAPITFVTALLFVRELEQQNIVLSHNVWIFWLTLAIGTVAWTIGVIILRVITAPITWALCHTIWHIVPALGAMYLFRSTHA